MYAHRAAPTVADFVRISQRRLVVAYAAAGFCGLMVAAFSLFINPYLGFPVSAGIFALGLVLIAVRPIAGVYLITLLGLLADNVTAPYWPFLKNGSSVESWLYVDGAIFINPMEWFLLFTLLATAVHVALRRISLTKPPLIVPVGTLLGFVVVGALWGFGRGGADLKVGLWELRPFFTLFLLYLLATNLITTRRQVRALYLTVVAAVSIEGVRTAIWYAQTTDADLFNSIVEHSAATHINFVLISVFIGWVISNSGIGFRLFLPLVAAPAIWAYLISERRSAIAALLVGVFVVLIFLRAENKSKFMLVAPALLIVGGAYTAAFWNAEGPIAYPAGAIKAQIAPTETSYENQASDLYRQIEHFDIVFTIRQNPLLGVGFGQKYYRPIPLPDISAGFIWWEYITHNGLLWIWLKTGYFGFVSMFFLIGRSLVSGLQNALQETNPFDKVIAVAATAFVAMYVTFSYVDISWGAQDMILMAVCLTIIARSGDSNRSDTAPPELSSSTELVKA